MRRFTSASAFFGMAALIAGTTIIAHSHAQQASAPTTLPTACTGQGPDGKGCPNSGQGWRNGGEGKEGYGHRGGRVAEYIKELDKNNDGIISKEEYDVGMIERFKKADKTGKNQLSRADVEAMVREQLEKQVQRMSDGIYRYTDTNKDGIISKDEWDASQKVRFERMDKNKDGKIDDTEMKHRGRGRGGEGDDERGRYEGPGKR